MSRGQLGDAGGRRVSREDLTMEVLVPSSTRAKSCDLLVGWIDKSSVYNNCC
jgi:hypothetical protein